MRGNHAHGCNFFKQMYFQWFASSFLCLVLPTILSSSFSPLHFFFMLVPSQIKIFFLSPFSVTSIFPVFSLGVKKNNINTPLY